MNTEYADRKVKEVLAKTNGNAKLAEQALQTLTERDHRFLLSLVQPYLGGIVAHAIERMRKHVPVIVEKPIPETAKSLPKVAAKKAQQKNELSLSSMDDLMKAWANKFESTPSQTGANKAKASGEQVSQKHLDAMQTLVKKSYGKKEKI